ncbi:MAG TPA: hypothetical protein VJU87_09175 [Gemmatimonadaceae bacterium]|nr:hypothetical protein [Gemmatimonadaceae bacterium]
MYALDVRPNYSGNAFADLEQSLSAVALSGERLAAATTSLRASARVFAQATARLQKNAGGKARLKLIK